MSTHIDLGVLGEDRAVRHLRAAGFTILDRNWRCAAGELDVIAARGREIAIVEVKTRRSMAFGDPLAAVDARKLARLRRLALAWWRAHPDHTLGRHMRIDVIGITGARADGDLVHLEDVR